MSDKFNYFIKHLTTFKVSKDRKYYIAVINQDLHFKQWSKIKKLLKATDSCYCVFYSNVKEFEFNQVTQNVYHEMCYLEN